MELMLKQIGGELDSESIKRRVRYTLDDVTNSLVEFRKANDKFIDKVNNGDLDIQHILEFKNSHYWYVSGLLRTLEYFLPYTFSFDVTYGNVYLKCNDVVIWSEK